MTLKLDHVGMRVRDWAYVVRIVFGEAAMRCRAYTYQDYLAPFHLPFVILVL